MAAHDRSGTSKESLSGLPRHSAGEDGGSSGAANGHHGHHGHHEVPHANLILWSTMAATLIFFFIYFFLTIPLKAPDYPSSSAAGSGAAGSNSTDARLLAASESM